MIAVSYFSGTQRKGLLVWTESNGERHALGGFDPGWKKTSVQATTVITTDTYERVLPGWQHPDNIREINGVADHEFSYQEIESSGCSVGSDAKD